MLKKLKNIFSWVFGYDNEYTKREMALFTRIVLVLLLFIIALFGVLFIAHMKFGLSQKIMEMFWHYYLGFAKWLITAYAVTWVGQMGKAFMSKREEENIKLKRELAQLTPDNMEEEIVNEEFIEEDEES